MNSLLKALPGTAVVIREIAGGRGVRLKLAQLGLDTGSVVTVERNAPFGGPLLIRHDGLRIVLGRGVAGRIRVDEIAPCG